MEGYIAITILLSCCLTLQVEGTTQKPPGPAAIQHPCDAMVCETNKTCVVRNVICEMPPCDPVGVCVLTTREGTCPKAQPHNWWSQSSKCITRCGVDGECIGERKCCTYGCMALCRNPVEVAKPGNCPAIASIDSTVPCNRLTSCGGDGECPWRMKCCEMVRCGMKCQMPDFPTAAITRKDGRCPRKAMVSLEQLAGTCGPDKCNFDSQCTGKQRCCGRCPRACANPAPARREGRCPWSWMRLFLPPFFCTITDKCSGDEDCNIGQKCCGRCPRRCRSALPARQLRCPPTSMFKACRHRNSCDTDQMCVSGQKCCKTRCGMKCMRCWRRFF